MEKPNIQAGISAAARVGGPNVNLGAAQLAAAFGLNLGSRTYLEPMSEKLAFRWNCTEVATGQDWTMELVCLPVLFGQEGWIGSVRISHYGVMDLISRDFVSYGHRLYGRKACKLTRERFCDWAATLEPGSRITTNRAAIEPVLMEAV